MIQFVSTKGESPAVSFREAIKNGLAPDGGLYMPKPIPQLPESFWSSLTEHSIQKIAFEVCRLYTEGEFSVYELESMIDHAINFEAPLIELYDDISILELYHGPTLAFKDFGARFMAQAFSRLDQKSGQDQLILVATSGDTGSAVANGFYGVPGTRVCLLYPSGKVSNLQEKQMTTLGANVTALEVNGTFDDCQKLVKQAFNDEDLRSKLRLSSANSINFARLLPQTFYYIHALSVLRSVLGEDSTPVFSVPSGNFGNLTAGLLASRMGMPFKRFLAATNRNDVVPEFLETGVFRPRPSVQTISNAMDVGNPSNFDRIHYLFRGELHDIRNEIWGASFDDRQTRECIRRVYKDWRWVVDPHTAVGILAAEKFREETGSEDPVIVLSTAHPAKFSDIVEEQTGKPVEIPNRLKACLEREKRSEMMENDYTAFRTFLEKGM
ncbi:MAG: threonine synthase [Balneolaceae bacterium]